MLNVVQMYVKQYINVEIYIWINRKSFLFSCLPKIWESEQVQNLSFRYFDFTRTSTKFIISNVVILCLIIAIHLTTSKTDTSQNCINISIIEFVVHDFLRFLL